MPGLQEKFHRFSRSVNNIALPDKFTNPFHYTPHPLCVWAAEEVQAYIGQREEWREELEAGKMFGVLVVRNGKQEVGYIAAFSGLLAGRNQQDFFVPPIYDLQQTGGFFQVEEEHISALNRQIRSLENDVSFLQCQQALEEERRIAALAIGTAKMQLQRDKLARDLRRQSQPSPEETEAMVRESQYQKAELKRLKEHHARQIETAQAAVDTRLSAINRLKTERKERSAALQQRLFRQFRIWNYRGEVKDLCELFADTTTHTPPAGAGECAAPRLLQYAYLHRLQPLAMAEFWWGASPVGEIRHQGYYYPACKGKCEPILRHVLQGLEVEDNPPQGDVAEEPEILWEDAWYVALCKPAGMLSVPGKSDCFSIEGWLRERYPQATGPLIVHRLDMGTSGVLLAAKTKEAHKRLQAMFKNRRIKKRYIALVDGIVPNDEGFIDLPLCPDVDDRPRQIVSSEYGKPATTRYRVLDRLNGHTRIAFYPETGRTHQLRVHAAHHHGLGIPILGDPLYGHEAERLYLHAEAVEFQHPFTGENILIEKVADF